MRRGKNKNLRKRSGSRRISPTYLLNFAYYTSNPIHDQQPLSNPLIL